ncbi:unnamed protein product [Onchocerca ochengi]|uniref:FERM domain-containing protein n=1 Tax=Onchocerca ochengi TaxID=42157 RepID=A0A182E6C6_ONCOC|nr:unnamed protein product [Onchocerca ochengi]
MLNQKKSAGFFHLFINNCISYETAIRCLQSILSSSIGSKLQIANFERNGKVSWVKIALFDEIDEEELTDIFKLHCIEIGLENIEIISDRPDLTIDIRNHLTVCQQQSYFTKEMELLKQQTGIGDKRISYGLSYQLMFHSKERTTVCISVNLLLVCKNDLINICPLHAESYCDVHIKYYQKNENLMRYINLSNVAHFLVVLLYVEELT